MPSPITVLPQSLVAGETYTLLNDVSMSTPFTSVGAGVIFDGSGHTITIAGIPNFLGLFSTVATVKNLGILPSGTTTLADSAGWFFATTISGDATNCYSTGEIRNWSGGIFGQGSAGHHGRGEGPCQDAQGARRQKGFPLFGRAAPAADPFSAPCEAD